MKKNIKIKDNIKTQCYIKTLKLDIKKILKIIIIFRRFRRFREFRGIDLEAFLVNSGFVWKTR